MKQKMSDQLIYENRFVGEERKQKFYLAAQMSQNKIKQMK